MSRRGSLNPASQRGKTGGYDPNKRRPSAMKEEKGRNSLTDSSPIIKDGDVFYKTVKSFPSHPELGEEVVVTVTKHGVESSQGQEKGPGGMGGSSGRKSAQESRRGSTMPERIREEPETPPDDFTRTRYT